MRSELKEEQWRQDLLQQNSTHTFILKKIGSAEQMVGGIVVSNNHQFRGNINKPNLNIDRKHYTPLFINDSEKGSLQSMDEQWSQCFGECVEQQCAKKITLLIPKPKSTFCYVCKQHYQDYLKHINHPIHKKWRDASYCEEDIKRFIYEFQQKIKHKEEDRNNNKAESNNKSENTAGSFLSNNQNQEKASICSTKFLNFD